MLRKLITFILWLGPIVGYAQGALTGNIFDNTNRSTLLEGVVVKNLTNKAVALTNRDGHFAVPAKVGDLISFGMVGYQTDTVYLINLFPRNVYLRASVTNLNTVNVTAIKLSPFLDLKDPNAQPVRQVDYAKERGGIRLNLGYGKYRKDQLKIQELEEYASYLDEINRNFTASFVKDLLKIEGEDLKNFMQVFRPTVDEVKSERPFNYAFYTAKSYRAWLKLPEGEKKLPSLLKIKGNE